MASTKPQLAHSIGLDDRGGTSAIAGPNNSSLPPSQNLHDQAQVGEADRQTLSNTLANSHITSPGPIADAENQLVAPIPTRPARFTEEWDASQRGSSIIDVPHSTAAMQRSNSHSGSFAGDTAVGVSRNNTLK